MKNKKIAFFALSLSNGGAERVISNLLLNLEEKKYEKYLILMDQDDISYPYQGKLLGLKILKKHQGINKILNYILAYWKLKAIKKKYQFDIVISFLEVPSFLNILTRENEKVIISVRNYTSQAFEGIKAKIYFPLIKKLYNFSDKIISVSKEAKEDLINFFRVFGDKIEVIHNFYDLNKIQELAKEELEPEYKKIFEKKVIINTGRLIKQKGQKYLIKAFSEIKNRDEYNLVILGEGELKKELQEQCMKLGVEREVYFLGFQKNPFKFLSRAYMFVFPSLFEGFPNALSEAMACGLPIISSNCQSGPKEILEDKYGLLIDDYLDEEKVIKALKINIEKLQNIEIRDKYSKRSRERIKEFSKEKILLKWEKCIDEILNDKEKRKI